MLNIEKLHKDSLVFLEDQEKTKNYLQNMSFPIYILEFRTITLGLPRRSGKTKYLLELNKKLSSMLFMHNSMVDNCNYLDTDCCDKSNIVSFNNNIDSVLRQVCYDKPFGFKYSVFLIDEYSYMNEKHIQNLKILLNELNIKDMFSEDFYVLRLGTPII